MSDNLLETIQRLMDSGIGDFQRLEHIMTSIKTGKNIYSSNQRYLETIISKNITDESIPILFGEVNTSKSVENKLGKILPIKTSPLWYYLPLFFNIMGGTISYVILRKTDLKKAKKCFIFGLIIFLIPIITFVVLNFVPGMQYSAYMVKKSANDQNIGIYDVAIIDSNISIENIKVGDVIIFYNPSTHQVVLIHRVVQILSKNPITVKTKGDKSLQSIEGLDYPITKQEYIGKLVYIIPQVGYVTKLITAKSIVVAIFSIVGIGIVQHMLQRKRNPQL